MLAPTSKSEYTMQVGSIFLMVLIVIFALLVRALLRASDTGDEDGIPRQVLGGASAIANGKRQYKYGARSIMTRTELDFFHRLSTAVPYVHVFPQVAMSALIEPEEDKKQWRGAFAAISQKRVDYAVFSRSMELVCVVELDDRTHDAVADAERDRMLSTAGIVTVRWDCRREPSEEEIRTVLTSHLSVDQKLAHAPMFDAANDDPRVGDHWGTGE